MNNGGKMEDRSTLLLNINVNMANWNPRKRMFYKELIGTITVGSMIIVRGTILDHCFPIPAELLPIITPKKYGEINQLGMFSEFEMDVSSTTSTYIKLSIIKTDYAPEYTESSEPLDSKIIE